MTRQQIEYLGDIANDLHRAIEAERTAQFELAAMIARDIDELTAFLIDPESWDGWAWTEPTDGTVNEWWRSTTATDKLRRAAKACARYSKHDIYPESECGPQTVLHDCT